MVYFTFCWGVAVPSVPARQFSIWFLFPKDMNSLKQALALMTDLQESLLTSQGPSARTDEIKTRRRLIWIRIVTIELGCKQGDLVSWQDGGTGIPYLALIQDY